MKETELAKIVFTWLEKNGWDCYPEVHLSGSGRVADIIAIKKDIIWIIETKTSFGKAVLGQCWYHICLSPIDKVSCAVPHSSRNTSRVERLANYNGDHKSGCVIGLLEVKGDDVIETVVSSNNYSRMYKVEERRGWYFNLPERLKTHCAPGSPAGGVLTPFKVTCEQIHDYVRKHRGCTIRELVEGITHHYSSDKSARSCISNLSNVIQEKSKVTFKWVSGRWRLYPLI